MTDEMRAQLEAIRRRLAGEQEQPPQEQSPRIPGRVYSDEWARRQELMLALPDLDRR
jgi:hypothetical protein